MTGPRPIAGWNSATMAAIETGVEWVAEHG